MWWKWLIPSTAKLRAGMIVVVIIAMSGVFFLGYTRGQDRGFGTAYDQFQRDIRALDSQWRDTVLKRDEQITSTIANEFNRIDAQIQQYILNDERERELISRLDVLSSTLMEMRDESVTTDFGTCEFSPEFERLLQSAREAISRPGTD